MLVNSAVDKHTKAAEAAAAAANQGFDQPLKKEVLEVRSNNNKVKELASTIDINCDLVTPLQGDTSRCAKPPVDLKKSPAYATPGQAKTELLF